MSSSISSSDDRTGPARRFAIAFLALFVLGVLAFVVGSEVLIRRVVAPTDGFERYRSAFRNATAPVVAFGDSHVANAIVTSPEVVNLGQPAETLPLMLFKADAYARSGRAKAVILQVAPQQFAIYRAENAQEGVRDELVSDFEPLLQFMRPHFRRYLLSHWRAAIEQWVTPAGAIPALQPPSEQRTFADWPAAEQRRQAEIRVQLHAPLPAGPTTEQLLAQLRASLGDLRKAGIAVCLVRYPLSEAYRTATSDVPAFTAFAARVANLAGTQGARFVDLHDAVPDRMLVDPDHVSMSARESVTRMILERCFGGESRTS